MRSKYLSAVALSLALCAGSAFAADLPSRKAPAYLPPPPPPLWTGFYVGLNAGGTWSDENRVNFTASPGPCNPVFPGCAANPNSSFLAAALMTFTSPSNTNGGFIGGGQIGYNYQFSNFVVGIEADIQGVASSGNGDARVANAVQNPNFINTLVQETTVRRSIDYLGTVRGRVGYLVTPSLLVFGSGGLAYGGVNFSSATIYHEPNDRGLLAPAFGAGAFSDTRVGWTAGGGVEWMFWPNWSAKAEYLYYDLGSVTTSVGVLALRGARAGEIFSSAIPVASTRFDGHIARVGVNYHFNWGAPAPAVSKY
jgi:outer membrane immunogenic protein